MNAKTSPQKVAGRQGGAVPWRRMPRKPRKAGPSTLSFKAPQTLIDSLDELVERWTKERHGLYVSRSQVVMRLIREGLARYAPPKQ